MKTGRMKKALLTVGAAVALAAMFFVIAPSAAANAYDGGSGAGTGGGGGGGGGSWGAITRWNYVDTWDQLVNAKYMQVNMNNSGAGAQNASEAADWFVRTSSGGEGLLQMCKGPNLVRIYYLGAEGGIPIKPNSSTGTFKWGGTAVQGDTADQYASTINYRGTYVICVINPTERITKTQTESRPMGTSTTVSGVYAWTTSVNPEIKDADGRDPIGKNNLNTQPASTKKSNFGNLADGISQSGPGNYDNKLVDLQSAIGKDSEEHHGDVVLNEGNREGMAEGGVLSLSEHTLRATVSLSQSWSESRSRTYTCDYVPNTNGGQLANPANCSYDNWSGWSEDNGSRSHRLSNSLPTQQATAFWQLLSVHCNPEELEAALAAYGNDYNVISQERTDEGVTVMLSTKPQASRPVGAGANIFGVTSVGNAALARTGAVGFYDKHCDVQCLTDPAGSGASTSNGASKNVSNTSNRGGGGSKGGAVLGDSNSNYFEVFRDNDKNRISVNVAYPQVEGTAFNYAGTAPIATTVSLWNGSTPSTRAANGGQFSMWAVNGDGSKHLFTGVQKPSEQTNFTLADGQHPIQAFSGPTATKLAGSYRTFDVAATWASEAKAPVVLNVKWEYQPTTKVSVPASVGMNANRSMTYATVYRDQKIDVDCYAAFGTGASDPTGFYAPAMTGSGVPNTIDGNILNAGMIDGSAAETTEQNLVVRFVRGVAK